MSPPHTIKEALLDPIHTALHVAFVVSACALFSKTWIEVSGSGPRDVAKQLKDQQMVSAHTGTCSCVVLTMYRSWLVTGKVQCTRN